VRFFFDNCISSNLTEAMRLLNRSHHEIQHLTDRFPADVLDEVWLPALAPESDLIVISADPSITSAKKERAIWERTGLTSFFFAGNFADRRFWVQTLEMVRWWPEIVLTAKDAKKGTGYLLPFKGTGSPRLFYQPYRRPLP